LFTDRDRLRFRFRNFAVRSVSRPAIVADAVVTADAIDARCVHVARVRVCFALVKVFAEKTVPSKSSFNFWFFKNLNCCVEKTCFRVVRWIPTKNCRTIEFVTFGFLQRKNYPVERKTGGNSILQLSKDILRGIFLTRFFSF
jgi:hypothetical protein